MLWMDSFDKIGFQAIKGAGNGAFFVVMCFDWTSLNGVPRIHRIMGYFWCGTPINYG